VVQFERRPFHLLLLLVSTNAQIIHTVLLLLLLLLLPVHLLPQSFPKVKAVGVLLLPQSKRILLTHTTAAAAAFSPIATELFQGEGG
jgi:hypothetical protein